MFRIFTLFASIFKMEYVVFSYWKKGQGSLIYYIPKGFYDAKSTVVVNIFLQKEMCTCWIFLKYLFMFLTAGHMNYEAHN